MSLKLACNDSTQTWLYRRHVLVSRFSLIADFCRDVEGGNIKEDGESVIRLQLTAADLDLTLNYIDTLQVPTKHDSWICLVTTCDYLGLQGRHLSLLINDCYDYLKSQEIPVYTSLSLPEILKKLRNKFYLAQKEFPIHYRAIYGYSPYIIKPYLGPN